MPRPRLKAGELGTVGYTTLANGTVCATARMRDDAGALHRFKAFGSDDAAALASLEQQADAVRFGKFGAVLKPTDTIAHAADIWLAGIELRAKTGTLAYSTYEHYEVTVRLTVKPWCGGIALEDFTVGRCNRIVQAILQEVTPSAARRARAVLSLICGFAVRDDAIPLNPVRDIERLPRSEKKTSVLTPEQIAGIRVLMGNWRKGWGMGPRPNYRALLDGMDIMLGTSARIGECVGLRRCDVDITTSPPTALINGTITQTKAQGIRRKDTPKRARQRRRVALPAFAAAAVRRRLALTEPGPEALLFQTKNGRPMSVSNYERLLRSFIEDNREALIELGVDVEEYSTHIYRRTVATLIVQHGGLSLASRLLGHANEQITRVSYVVSAEQVDPMTADIMDSLLAEGT